MLARSARDLNHGSVCPLDDQFPLALPLPWFATFLERISRTPAKPYARSLSHPLINSEQFSGERVIFEHAAADIAEDTPALLTRVWDRNLPVEALGMERHLTLLPEHGHHDRARARARARSPRRACSSSGGER